MNRIMQVGILIWIFIVCGCIGVIYGLPQKEDLTKPMKTEKLVLKTVKPTVKPTVKSEVYYNENEAYYEFTKDDIIFGLGKLIMSINGGGYKITYQNKDKTVTKLAYIDNSGFVKLEKVGIVLYVTSFDSSGFQDGETMLYFRR